MSCETPFNFDSAHIAGLVASINRNFRGLGRELFTDTGTHSMCVDRVRADGQDNTSFALTRLGQNWTCHLERVSTCRGSRWSCRATRRER